MGRLTKDPEIRYTQSTNTMVASFTLAVNRRFAKPGEEKQADFIYITAWSKTAEFVSKYFRKGQQVGIIGRLEQHEWTSEDGKKQSKTQVVAEEVYFADSKRENTETSNNTTTQTTNFEITSNDDLPF